MPEVTARSIAIIIGAFRGLGEVINPTQFCVYRETVSYLLSVEL
jgi:hypothetical protein